MDEAKQQNDRKTLDDRNKMTELERIRHSCAHVLATAILRLWPDAQFAAGPPVENGFYYDVELSHRISPEDFEKIEAEMKKEIKANHPFEKSVVTREQAIKDAESGRLGGLGERPGNPSKFKLGNLADIPEGEPISYFKNGDFIDLCAGPHVMRTGNIGAFKLTNVASAYYKGDEKNPQLQRIYGTAFKNKTEMEAYFKMLEEAKRRDHRKIGAEMGLFAMDPDYVGPGLPLWLPKGGAIIEELEKLAKETEFAAGYVRVRTPHLAREKMYLTSGHLPMLYAESMFPPMELVEEKNKRRLRKLTALRAKLEGYDGETWNKSLEDAKTADFSDEAGKAQILEGLDLVRMAENIDQAELNKVDQLIEFYRRTLLSQGHELPASPPHFCGGAAQLSRSAFAPGRIRHLLSLRAVRRIVRPDARALAQHERRAHLLHTRAVRRRVQRRERDVSEVFQDFRHREIRHALQHARPAPPGENAKFVNEPELWKQTEDMVRNVLEQSRINYVEVPNEAAFYGPKIDVQVWSVIGREFTLATNQVDFAVPARFGLVYRDKDNTEKTPLCIHRAPLGTHERFIGFLIEHYAGNFPLWLAPEQVRVLTIGDEEPLVNYAKSIVQELRANMVRAEGDFATDKINGKIQRAEKAKVHTMLVIGRRDMEAGNVSVRLHGKGNLGAKPKAEVIADIFASIKERRP